ncbi:PREDICTED: potassium voltage-gated channel subfamily E member 3 [Mesitornis unicolor]|uniref:potassium voltage-gated channel subfamily E member 3 n=1 Tax=Mesitornis unicolor TaxID=54374 RepID=UPI000528D86A|nr:PREDICTED: potassium voltage-gated channel subfamily E member 3 [Mesitornis unicolor]
MDEKNRTETWHQSLQAVLSALNQTLCAARVGSLILGYTRSRKVDKRSDPYHVYIKNRVSMI